MSDERVDEVLRLLIIVNSKVTGLCYPKKKLKIIMKRDT
jgi:hypothetical protein